LEIYFRKEFSGINIEAVPNGESILNFRKDLGMSRVASGAIVLQNSRPGRYGLVRQIGASSGTMDLPRSAVRHRSIAASLSLGHALMIAHANWEKKDYIQMKTTNSNDSNERKSTNYTRAHVISDDSLELPLTERQETEGSCSKLSGVSPHSQARR
jgi:hypothetical protein